MFAVVGTIRPLDLELVCEPKSDTSNGEPPAGAATRIEEAIEALGNNNYISICSLNLEDNTYILGFHA